MKPNLRGIDLNLLTIFDAIWEDRQMSRAARRLGMSQPAASQALSRLRLTFQDELFIRSHQGMKPTPRAEALAGPIRDALRQIQDAIVPTGVFDPSAEKRQFNLAFARFGELSLLPLLLQAVGDDAPGLSFRSIADERRELFDLLRDNEADVGFDYRRPKDDTLDCCLFEREEMVVIARPDHPRLDRSLSSKDYFREQHVVLNVPDKERVTYERVFSRHDARRKILAEAQQALAIPPLVMTTDALATVPGRLARAPLFVDKLAIYPMPFEVAQLPVYMCWHRAMARDTGHRWLKEQMLALREQL